MRNDVSHGDVFAAFEKMRIHHPRLKEVNKWFEAAREVQRKKPFSAKRHIEFLAPSHSGKSTAIQTYIEDFVVDQAIAKGHFPADMDREQIALQQKIVLHVTLSPKASVKSMASDILRKLGDPRAASGDGPVLLRRVYEYLAGTYKDPATGKIAERQTEVLVLDEIQHLATNKVKKLAGKSAKSSDGSSTEVAETLKTMMIRGLVPIVLVGVPEAAEHLDLENQLLNREMAKIDFSPLRWSSAKDQEIFLEYCAEAAALIQKHELLEDETDLLEGEIPHRLWAASGGCIGLVSRILEEAVFHVLDREGTSVEFEDLALAVDTRAIPNKMCTYNPFREGVRKSTIDPAP